MILKDKFEKEITQLYEYLKSNKILDNQDVYKEGSKKAQEIIETMLKQVLLEDSGLKNENNLISLYQKAQKGESCLILSQHFSNTDIPCLFYFLKLKGLTHISDAIIPLASYKLGESLEISLFFKSYPSLTIYPARVLENIKDLEEKDIEKRKSKKINLTSLRILKSLKNNGKIFFIFPAGTRYKENDLDTKRGLPEVFSYIKSFDNILPMSINGNILKVNNEDMTQDLIEQDKVIHNFGEIINSKNFIRSLESVKDENKKIEKQLKINVFMDILEKLHKEVKN